MANKSKRDDIAQMLLFKTGDLAEVQQLNDKLALNLQSAQMLADGLRETMNRERLAVGEALRDLREVQQQLLTLAKRLAGVCTEIIDNEPVEFVDLDAEFVTVDQRNDEGE